MDTSSSSQDVLFYEESVVDYDREKEVKAFDDTKAGVKGLVDAGVAKLPKMFIRPADELVQELNMIGTADLEVPIIDLSGIHESRERREEVVGQVRTASDKWGFFQVVNHGVPSSILEEMIEKTRMFHDQDDEVKKGLYTRDQMRRVRYECNYDLFQSRAANWRDTLNISMLVSDQLEPDEIPIVCRAAATEYIEHVTKLGGALFELLSEALGLKHDHLNDLELGGRTFVFHYYPACPEPDLTLGSSKHTDPSFLTVVLQDELGGLQVMHENQWIDVKPIPGGLVVNVGDFLQMISNDKFKSANHRVTANHVGPRISVASFFIGTFVPPKLYGPIKELASEAYPPLYRDFLVTDYIVKFLSKPLDESGLDQFKI